MVSLIVWLYFPVFLKSVALEYCWLCNNGDGAPATAADIASTNKESEEDNDSKHVQMWFRYHVQMWFRSCDKHMAWEWLFFWVPSYDIT